MQDQPASPHIGTLNEKPLHASLKMWVAEPGDQFEVRIGRFVADIVRHLRARLPRYAVPAEVVGLSVIPRTGNGKVDRPAVADWHVAVGLGACR